MVQYTRTTKDLLLHAAQAGSLLRAPNLVQEDVINIYILLKYLISDSLLRHLPCNCDLKWESQDAC